MRKKIALKYVSGKIKWVKTKTIYIQAGIELGLNQAGPKILLRPLKCCVLSMLGPTKFLIKKNVVLQKFWVERISPQKILVRHNCGPKEIGSK